MPYQRLSKDEAMAQVVEMIRQGVSLHIILRYLSTQSVDKCSLGAKRSRNLLNYEWRLKNRVADGKLTLVEAVHQHVRYLDQLAAASGATSRQS